MKTLKAHISFLLVTVLISIIIGIASSHASEKTTKTRTDDHPTFPLVGIAQSEKRFLDSKLMKERYAIDVWLPRDYYESRDKTYPTVYLTDSELNFPLASYVVSRLIKNKDMPPVILIGISHDTTYEDWYYVKRARDLTPVPWKHKDFPQTGGALKFLEVLEKEVFSFVEKNYRANKENKTLVGVSFGGLFSHFVMFNSPSSFQRYLIVSPSIWYGDRFLITHEKKFAATNKRLSAKVYTAVGGEEPSQFVFDWKTLNDQMKRREYAGLTLKADLLEGEHHRSISPRAFTNGFRFLFKETEDE